MRESTIIAVDHAKSVFEIAVSDYPGHVKERHRLSRSRIVPFFAEHQPATVLLEACGSAHHWGRCFELAGHQVVLLPPHAVRPYVTRNKTDRADAKGLLEAFRNQDTSPPPTVALLAEAKSKGWTADQIARKAGVSKWAVYGWNKRGAKSGAATRARPGRKATPATSRRVSGALQSDFREMIAEIVREELARLVRR